MSLVPTRSAGAVFGATIFVGAFLLFQIQLVIAKYILPWYGGVPTVWTTCMLFFQVLLLAGYAYAHLLARRLPPARQRALHLSLVVVAVGALILSAMRWGVPLLPGSAWKPGGHDSPTAHIVLLLAVSVGTPYFVAATTAPLIQSWFAGRYPTTSPYRLYALSNAGSLFALLSYPAFFEIWLDLTSQAWLWGIAFLGFATGVLACALLANVPAMPDAPVTAHQARGMVSGGGAALPLSSPRAVDWTMWILLAAVPSWLLLATTNYMSQEIAVVPLLWIAPLSMYLLSFIITFENPRWYARGIWAGLLAVGITLAVFVVERGVLTPMPVQIGVAALMLFAACMVCHGELARLKPAPTHLTTFYLAVTLGGAAGGAFVSLGAPLLFPGTWEYPLGIWLVGALTLVRFFRDRESPFYVASIRAAVIAAACGLAIRIYVFRAGLPWPLEIPDRWLFGGPAIVAAAAFAIHAWCRRAANDAPAIPRSRRAAARVAGVSLLALLVAGVAVARLSWSQVGGALETSRTFYGTVQVEAVDAGTDLEAVRMRHGRIIHGRQHRASQYAREPTAYFGRHSGVGLAVEHHPRRSESLRVGVVGLGVGTLAAYGRAGDVIRFYELNPDVVRLAGPSAHTFTYLRNSPARVDVLVGDARLVMEAQLQRGEAQRFDVLAIDAFSSDAIPAHLLTREALAVYLAHLDPGGVLAIHISNGYVDLQPVIRGLAEHADLALLFVEAKGDAMTWESLWALLARDPARLRVPAIADAASRESANSRRVLWTDAYSNLLAVLKR